MLRGSPRPRGEPNSTLVFDGMFQKYHRADRRSYPFAPLSRRTAQATLGVLRVDLLLFFWLQLPARTGSKSVVRFRTNGPSTQETVLAEIVWPPQKPCLGRQSRYPPTTVSRRDGHPPSH